MLHVWGTGEGRTGFWRRDLTERDQLEARRREWEDNIKEDLQEMRWVGMKWINLAQDRERWRALVNSVMR